MNVKIIQRSETYCIECECGFKRAYRYSEDNTVSTIGVILKCPKCGIRFGINFENGRYITERVEQDGAKS